MPRPLDSGIRRSAVRLLFLENVSTRDTAAALGIAVSTVSRWKTQHKKRALTRLVNAHKFLVAGDADRAARELRSGLAMLGQSVGDD